MASIFCGEVPSRATQTAGPPRPPTPRCDRRSGKTTLHLSVATLVGQSHRGSGDGRDHGGAGCSIDRAAEARTVTTPASETAFFRHGMLRGVGDVVDLSGRGKISPTRARATARATVRWPRRACRPIFSRPAVLGRASASRRISSREGAVDGNAKTVAALTVRMIAEPEGGGRRAGTHSRLSSDRRPESRDWQLAAKKVALH